jgi:branched-chain amino acid transport system substrate-binding protein
VDALADAYFAKYKIQPATNYYPDAYDAAGLLLAAIENVAVQWPDGTLYIGRQALREALYTTKDYPGIAGDLACDRFGDCADPVFNVMRLEDPDAGIQGLLSNIVFSHAPNKKTIQ